MIDDDFDLDNTFENHGSFRCIRRWKPNQSNGLCLPEAKGRKRGTTEEGTFAIDRDDGTVADRRHKTSLGTIHTCGKEGFALHLVPKLSNVLNDLHGSAKRWSLGCVNPAS